MPAADVDFSLLSDVVTEVQEHLPQLERDLHRLVATPESGELLASAFRHIHTIKGDFGYCHATPIMDFVHRVEGVLQSLREKRYQCSALVAEALLQSMDQVLAMMEVLVSTYQFDSRPRERMTSLIEQLALARNQADADQLSRHILLAAHGDWMPELEPGAPASPTPAAADAMRAKALGEQLAAALARRHTGWHDRAALQRRLVLALNARYPVPVNEDTLVIAVLWHDVGLLALDDVILRRPPAPKTAHWAAYADHPEQAARWLLSIAPDCTEAAQIIRQHHALLGGGGIPAPDHPLPPHRGAMMLGCADLLHERVAGLAGEEFRRGVLRAVFDVNGGLESRFDAALINAFQAVAREFSDSA